VGEDVIKKYNSKPVVMISFREGGENGGPYNSHKRIIESSLKEKYNFIPLVIPKGRIGVFNIRIIRKLRKEILVNNPDIVHFTGLQLEGFHIALACRLANLKKCVVAIHGSTRESLGYAKWKKMVINLLEILTLRLVSHSYGVSDYVGSWDLIQYSNNYFGTIYNLPYLKKNYKYENQILFRDEYGIDKNDILIVSTGRITEEKGYGVLLNIILKMNIPTNLKFIIIGEGSYLSTFKEQIMVNKKNDSVLCLGYREDIIRILHECDIFIMPSLHETLCMSVLEAGYCGLPSLVSKVGGLPEIIEQNYNGYLVEANNEKEFIKYLHLLVSDEVLRKKMGKNAKLLVESKFNTITIINKIDIMYKAILNNETTKNYN